MQTVHHGELRFDWFYLTQEEKAMLVLSRKSGERILIGQNIVLTVIDIGGDRVRLAFDAPRDVSIHRQEVYRRIQDEGVDEVQFVECTNARCG